MLFLPQAGLFRSDSCSAHDQAAAHLSDGGELCQGLAGGSQGRGWLCCPLPSFSASSHSWAVLGARVLETELVRVGGRSGS